MSLYNTCTTFGMKLHFSYPVGGNFKKIIYNKKFYCVNVIVVLGNSFPLTKTKTKWCRIPLPTFDKGQDLLVLLLGLALLDQVNLVL